VLFHVDAAAAERDAFGLEAEALLEGGFSTQLDFTAGAEDPLPREPDGAAQDADDLAGGAGMSGSAGDGTVSRDFAARDGANSGENIGVERHGEYFSVGGFAPSGAGLMISGERSVVPRIVSHRGHCGSQLWK
jgi:hypothetical protein